MKIHLLIIDPQNDFCHKNGSLRVPGADADMTRLAALVDRIGHKLEDIHVTMDSHHMLDVAHKLYWQDSQGNYPAPFTMISAADVRAGKWTPRIPDKALYDRTLNYLDTLEANGRYICTVWPDHCRIGTWGHNVYEPLEKALSKWEEKHLAIVDYVTKGSNPHTEHYSAVKAEVPDPADPFTQINTRLLQVLEEADLLLVGGEADSHCVLNTVKDIVAQFAPENVKKIYLLTDCMSSVADPPGTTLFTDAVAEFHDEMRKKGMQFVKSTEFLVD